MRTKTIFILLIACCLSCQSHEKDVKDGEMEPESETTFDETKWKTKDGRDYPYRDAMVNDVLHNDSLRGLHREEILDLLGEPDRTNGNFLYYMVDQKRLGTWPLHTRMLVFKFSEDDSVEWIKLHE